MQKLVFEVEHGQQAFAGDIARSAAVGFVADLFVLRRDGACDRTRRAADGGEPAGDLLTRADFGGRPVLGLVEVEGKSFGVDVAWVVFGGWVHGGRGCVDKALEGAKLWTVTACSWGGSEGGVVAASLVTAARSTR